MNKPVFTSEQISLWADLLRRLPLNENVAVVDGKEFYVLYVPVEELERQPPKTARKKRVSPERKAELDVWFAKLYGEWYPKKEKKALSYKAFISLDPDRETMGKISVDLQRRLGAPKDRGGWKDVEPQYIPALAVYLNQRRWEDR